MAAALGASISAQARIIFTCFTRLLQMKTRDTPLGVLSSLVEPLAAICVMTIVFTNIKFKVPKLGDYLMLFLMTGMLPISMFRQGSMESERGFQRLRRNLALPQVQTTDLMLAGIFTSFLLMTSLFMTLTIFFWLAYDAPWPQNIVFCLIPAVCNSLMGFGIGMINLVIKSWFLYWGTIFAVVTAPLGVMSGMFYTIDKMPPSIQQILYYNPLMHSTELTRTYYYKEYTSTFFDPLYYYGCVFTILSLGLLCERTFRYRILNEKKK